MKLLKIKRLKIFVIKSSSLSFPQSKMKKENGIKVVFVNVSRKLFSNITRVSPVSVFLLS